MKLLKKNFPIFIFIFVIFSYSPCHAQTVDSMYYNWVVYEFNENFDDKKCYIIATPTKIDSSYTAPRKPYIAITRYAKSRSEEISVYSDYEYKISSEVYLLIGNTQKQLYTNKDTAWAKSDLEDKEIIEMMLKSELVKIRSDSSIGNYSIDEYSMKGLTRAYARMKELCH